MTKLACRYAIIRFMPYRETEEFANVGIVLTCPEIGYFGYKLQTRRYAHITNFFEELDSDTYSSAIKLFSGELTRIKEQVTSIRSENSDILRKVFDSLFQPRESIISFSEGRPRLSEKPDDTLNQLFDFYVKRSFATPEYKENVVLRRVKQLLNSLKLEKPFQPLNIGDDIASAKFPLVQQAGDGQLVKAIKPFFLNQEEPGKIINHGGAWVDKIKRLRNRGLLPSSVLFAVDGPPQTAGNRYLAFQEICSDLKALEVAVIPTNDEKKIIEFAALNKTEQRVPSTH